ncbi:MAG: hypothetical protein KC621_22275 [Myxococcales bacterium]|nr:hypothetical protein [Myxococcales bacterium]
MLAELFLVSALAAPAGPRASSEMVDGDKVKHTAALAFDGLLSTYWAEGVEGDGAGQWIELKFDKPTDVSSISLFPGYLGGANREIREYGRPKLVTITLEVPGGEPVTRQERLLDPGEEGPLRHDVAISAPGATSMRITIDESFAGGLYGDVVLAEVAVNFVGGATPPAVQQVNDWLTSPDGAAAANAQREAAIALFDQISGAEFGDRESFRTLLGWTADGAPYLRDKVAKLPWGFRMHALQPDKTSIEALLKLKDSNAIPAIERASLRVTGALAEDLARRAKLFLAYQDLLGAKVRNMPPWGKTGIAQGALRGFGVGLDIAADQWGHVYVADTGNHRVQRFGADAGVVDRVWGSEQADVTDVWFDRRREPYASGAAPGEENGQFSNPASLAVVGGKAGDTVFVLDALGRLTEIGPEGAVVRVVKVPAEGAVGPDEAHVVANAKVVVVLMASEGFVYERKTWEEPERFELKEGPAAGAVLFSNTKLGLRYDDHLILYSTDGFRHGDLLGDTLGAGFEGWDATLDERGKLWVVLDTGTVIKYKKPGKVAFAVDVGEYSFELPRIAVFDDRVFITERDRILHADALGLLEKGDAGSGNLEIGE